MKAFIFPLFALCIFLSQVNSTVILVNYNINKEYISKNLCENRDKPELNCCGKCVVKKELAKEAKKESTPGASKEKETAKQVAEKKILTVTSCSAFFKTNFIYSFFIPSSPEEFPVKPPESLV